LGVSQSFASVEQTMRKILIKGGVGRKCFKTQKKAQTEPNHIVEKKRILSGTSKGGG